MLLFLQYQRPIKLSIIIYILVVCTELNMHLLIYLFIKLIKAGKR